MDTKPLMVVMGIRWIPLCKYWINEITFSDKLIIDGFPHHEAHKIARDYFLSHEEYTNLLIYGEDALFTPIQVLQLLSDYDKYKFDVISGYTNVNFNMSLSNVGMADLRKINVVDYKQYKLLDMMELMNFNDNDYFLKCFYVGLPLTLISRKVMEKVSFEPYRFITQKIGNVSVKNGIMQDVKFAIECAENGFSIFIDRRLFGLHYGNTLFLLKDNPFRRKVYLQKAFSETLSEITP